VEGVVWVWGSGGVGLVGGWGCAGRGWGGGLVSP